MDRKWVYLFSELEAVEATVDDWEGVRTLLGGKGANLAEMARIGVPVPPGFTVTTEACIAYRAVEGRFPADIWEEELAALKRMEAAAGKEFGNPEKPLLVSCRSGAKFSMPGMMDTILNLGMNDDVAEGMVSLIGDARFVYDAYRREDYVPFNSETLVTGKLFEDIRDAVHAQADPARLDAIVVINLCVPTASGVPLQLLPRQINGVRVIGISPDQPEVIAAIHASVVP